MQKISYIIVEVGSMLLIIQNGRSDTYISKYLKEKFELVKSSETDVSKINLDTYSMIIILGGHQTVTRIQEDIQLQNVVSLIKKCLSIDKPLVGVCLGCQLVAYALGCEIKSGELNIGYDTKILEYEHIFRCHYDYVVPNNKIQVMAWFNQMPYIITHKKLLGIQCHPDIPPEHIDKYRQAKEYYQFAHDHPDLIDSNNQKLLNWILDRFKKN